jgi:hypothetical protein
MVDDMVRQLMYHLQSLDEMGVLVDEVLDFQHLLVLVVQPHKALQGVHQILVVDELVEVDDQVQYDKMGNSLQILVMVEQEHQILSQEVQ